MSKERQTKAASNSNGNSINNITSNRKNDKDKKTEMGSKTTVRILQATNYRHFKREDKDMAKQRKPQRRN